MVGLLDHLHLLNHNRTLTLVGHNWGWLMGATLAKDHPNTFNNLVILNTNNLPDGEISPGRYEDMRTWIKFMVTNAWFLAFRASIDLLRENYPLSVLMHSLMRGYRKEEVTAMMAPHPTKKHMGGATSFPLLVPVKSSHPNAPEFSRTRYFLSTWHKPALVLFSNDALLPWLKQGKTVG